MVPISSLYVSEKGTRTSRDTPNAGKFLGLSIFLRSQRSPPAAIHVGYNVISFSSGHLTSLERA